MIFYLLRHYWLSFDNVLRFFELLDDPDFSQQEKILAEISFGGGCINDTLLHLTNNKLPFGGVGASGMGNYHGQFSFYTFSHAKAILNKSTLIDVPLRYPPYQDGKLGLIKKVVG